MVISNSYLLWITFVFEFDQGHNASLVDRNKLNIFTGKILRITVIFANNLPFKQLRVVKVSPIIVDERGWHERRTKL